MLARIPSIMMWDDHDIFDGWGSHPDNLQSCPVYQRIFKSADRAFRLFQLRDKPGRIGAEPDPKHYGYVCQFCNETFLMLDHRTERTTTQVMGEGQWQEFKAWLATFEGERLFIQSAVPVVYRNFGFIERVVGATPRREEIEDDLLDHWSAREHQQERLRFVYSLVNRQKEIRDKRETNKEPFDARWVVLSGDVHVGCMGSIWEKELNLGVYQVVSSGIVHPPPTPFQWLGIRAVSGDGNDRIGNGDLETEIHPIAGASSEFLRTRNYARLQIGTDHKVWVNWRCESKEETVFAI